MAKRFVFLEIDDREIVSLLFGIREIAMGGKPRAALHITVRGPYDKEIPRRQIEKYQQVLRSNPLLLQGVGSFESGDRHIVFIKVNHPGLRRIWWKPDFPVRTHGFNPHITLYEGEDSSRAKLLTEFLRRERLKLLTWSFRVTLHVSDHRDLFADRPAWHDEPFLDLVNRGLVRPDILMRLRRALEGPASKHGPRSSRLVSHPG